MHLAMLLGTHDVGTRYAGWAEAGQRHVCIGRSRSAVTCQSRPLRSGMVNRSRNWRRVWSSVMAGKMVSKFVLVKAA